MKNYFILLFVLTSFAVWSQEPEKDVKKAESKVANYYLDPSANLNKLWDAKSLIDGASENDLVKAISRTWSVKGKIYNDLRNPSSVQYFNNREKGRGLHPTQKPLALLEYLIKTYTNENDLVLDNCMGSGTTNLACIKLNRKSIGIEQEKKYFDIAVQRAKDFISQPKLF